MPRSCHGRDGRHRRCRGTVLNASTAGAPLATAEISTWRPAGGAVQQPRFAPDGTPTGVHDGAGWLNVHVGDRPVFAEGEHAGPTWGMGQRSYVVRPDGACVVARNRLGFGTLSIIDPLGGVRDLATDVVGVHGQLSMVDDRLVAMRSGPTTPPEIVIVDLAVPERPGRVVAASWGHRVARRGAGRARGDHGRP